MRSPGLVVATSAGALAGIALVDKTLVGAESLVIHGLGDEIGHLLTGYILVMAFWAAGCAVPLLPALVGSVIIDLDHLPDLLKIAEPQPGTSRFFTHSLLTVLLVLALSGMDRKRRVAWGALAVGLGSHLFRDLARGTVLLWWPLDRQPVGYPYWLYASTMLALLVWTTYSYLIHLGNLRGQQAANRLHGASTTRPSPFCHRNMDDTCH